MARGLRRPVGFFDGGGVTPSPTPSFQLYKRRYGAVDYLVDVDGKLVTDDTVYVEVGASGNPNACVLSLCSTNEILSDIIATWGKTPAVFSSQELGTTDYTITIGDNTLDVVGETATTAINAYTPTSTLSIRTVGGTSVTLVGVRNITGQIGSEDPVPSNVVVAYDAEENNYLIKNQNTEMWSYGAYLIHEDKYENEQPIGAWGSVTTPAPTNNNTVATEQPDDELATWLMNNGVSPKVFVHIP